MTVSFQNHRNNLRGGVTVMSISGSLASPDLLLPNPNPNRRLADTQPITYHLRKLALPAIDRDSMGALKQATSSFNVSLVYDVFENFFGTDLVDPIDEGMGYLDLGPNPK